MSTLRALSKVAVVVAMLLGIGLIVTGSIFIKIGVVTKGEIRDALLKEQIITSRDAPLPGVLVQDAETAKAQAAAVEKQTFGTWGPYSKMRTTDPEWPVYMFGLTLRTALNQAVMGFGVADIVIGLGTVALILGLIIVALAIPVHLIWTRVLLAYESVSSQASREDASP